MNRFKKELRNRGYKLECDYEWLPFEGVEAVRVDSENAQAITYTNLVGAITTTFTRAGELFDSFEDDDNPSF